MRGRQPQRPLGNARGFRTQPASTVSLAERGKHQQVKRALIELPSFASVCPDIPPIMSMSIVVIEFSTDGPASACFPIVCRRVFFERYIVCFVSMAQNLLIYRNRFRATKDIDVILLVEARFPEVAAAVWRLVKDGGYDCGWRSSEGVHFYRFVRPRIAGFPSMVELLSKAPRLSRSRTGLPSRLCLRAMRRRACRPSCLTTTMLIRNRAAKQSTALLFSMKSTLLPSRRRRFSIFRGGRPAARGSI